MRDAVNAAVRRVPTWGVYALGLLPVPWLFWRAATGALGVEPVEALEHAYGELALQFLVAGLCITPLRRFAGVNLIRFRRALGLVAFAYVVAHLAVWAVLDVQSVARVWADIVKRPYITVGMAAFVLMLPLAATSTDRAIRRMGPVAWRRLHRITYGVALLGGVHFLMQAKGFQLEPLLYLGAVVGLLLVRVRGRVQAPT